MNKVRGCFSACLIGTLVLTTAGCAHFGSQDQFPYQAKVLLRESLECNATGHPLDEASAM